MNKKVPQVNKLVTTFGNYSKPFLNMCLSNEKISPIWRMYFKSLMFSWKNKHSEALKFIEEVMDLVAADKTTHYFLITRKLTILLQLKDERGDQIYKKLSKELEFIPPIARKHVITTMLNYRAIRKIEGIEDFKRLRVWGKRYEEDKSILVFVLLGKARNEVKNGNTSKSFSIFLEALRISKNIPHPTGMINALNDMAWYLREVHPYWACEMAKRAVYWAGWYFEDAENVFYTFDTLFECQRLSDDVDMYETADIILLTSEYLPMGQGYGTQGHYCDRIESCRRVVPNFETSMYENTKALSMYLKAHMRSANHTHEVSNVGKSNILAILNGKVKKIRGDTIRKFIKGLNVEVSLEAPFGVLNEYLKMRVENNFNESIGKLKKMKLEKRTILFVSTYMGSFNRRKSIPYLSRKGKFKEAFNSLNDVEKFKSFMNRRYETMEFVNWMFEAHPFIQARKDLARKYLERMPKRVRERFISIYISLEEKDKSVIDRFLRDYTRYDIKWSMRIKAPQELQGVIRSHRLKKTSCALAYYALDNPKEREYLVEVLETVR